MNTNQPRPYSTDQVEEFIAQAIGAYTADARTNPDVSDAELEYILDIARHRIIPARAGFTTPPGRP